MYGNRPKATAQFILPVTLRDPSDDLGALKKPSVITCGLNHCID